MFGPFKVVGFIDYQQIPFSCPRLLQTPGLFTEERHGAKYQLRAFEWVFCTRFNQRLATFFIQDGEHQVETPQHFHQPLVYEAIGHRDQYPAGAAGNQLLVDN